MSLSELTQPTQKLPVERLEAEAQRLGDLARDSIHKRPEPVASVVDAYFNTGDPKSNLQKGMVDFHTPDAWYQVTVFNESHEESKGGQTWPVFEGNEVKIRRINNSDPERAEGIRVHYSPLFKDFNVIEYYSDIYVNEKGEQIYPDGLYDGTLEKPFEISDNPLAVELVEGFLEKFRPAPVGELTPQS